MNSTEVLENVIIPNIDDVRKFPGELRHAVNLIMSVELLLSTYYLEQKEQCGLSLSEKQFRGDLGLQSSVYKLFLDCAAALKHGSLNTKNRLVNCSSLIREKEPTWDDLGAWSDKHTWYDHLIAIEYDPRRAFTEGLPLERIAIIDILDELKAFWLHVLFDEPYKQKRLSYLKQHAV